MKNGNLILQLCAATYVPCCKTQIKSTLNGFLRASTIIWPLFDVKVAI